MHSDELREAIWEFLYHAKVPKTIDEIAAHAEKDAPTISAAVSHEWFTVVRDHVSIAYTSACLQ